MEPKYQWDYKISTIRDDSVSVAAVLRPMFQNRKQYGEMKISRKGVKNKGASSQKGTQKFLLEGKNDSENIQSCQGKDTKNAIFLTTL